MATMIAMITGCRLRVSKQAVAGVLADEVQDGGNQNVQQEQEEFPRVEETCERANNWFHRTPPRILSFAGI